MSIADETKTALDDSRTLMLGSQILLGLQLQAPFQNAFDALTDGLKQVELALVVLMVGAIGLLIAPSSRHRIVDDGKASRGFNEFVTGISQFTIPLFSLALALAIFVAEMRIAIWPVAPVIAIVTFIVTLAACGMSSLRQLPEGRTTMSEEKKETPLDARIGFILTEARVVLPGAQALLGFQLVIVLTQGFGQLADIDRIAHGVAVALIALATVCLMAPAARHRLVYDGENSKTFYTSANRYLLAGTMALAAGIGVDTEVVAMKITDNRIASVIVAVTCLGILYGLWLIWPLIDRRRAKR
jgi:hypothetical protein